MYFHRFGSHAQHVGLALGGWQHHGAVGGGGLSKDDAAQVAQADARARLGILDADGACRAMSRPRGMLHGGDGRGLVQDGTDNHLAARRHEHGQRGTHHLLGGLTAIDARQLQLPTRRLLVLARLCLQLESASLEELAVEGVLAEGNAVEGDDVRFLQVSGASCNKISVGAGFTDGHYINETSIEKLSAIRGVKVSRYFPDRNGD